MSRGFVKEDDQEDIPMVPPRAYLPQGVTNFVTPEGMNQLLAERHALTEEKNALDITGENEKRIALNYINAKMQLLNKRIAEAKVVYPEDQPVTEIRFGAGVTLKSGSPEKIQTIRIVGVDEADISEGKVSFISPIARVLINRKVGEKVILKQAGKDIIFEVMKITYSL